MTGGVGGGRSTASQDRRSVPEAGRQAQLRANGPGSTPPRVSPIGRGCAYRLLLPPRYKNARSGFRKHALPRASTDRQTTDRWTRHWSGDETHAAVSTASRAGTNPDREAIHGAVGSEKDLTAVANSTAPAGASCNPSRSGQRHAPMGCFLRLARFHTAAAAPAPAVSCPPVLLP